MQKFWGAAVRIAAMWLWNFAFPGQSREMKFSDPGVFTAQRSIIAAASSFRFREPGIWQNIRSVLAFLLFCGAGAGALPFTQKYLPPVAATLLMSLESVFAVTCDTRILTRGDGKP